MSFCISFFYFLQTCSFVDYLDARPIAVIEWFDGKLVEYSVSLISGTTTRNGLRALLAIVWNAPRRVVKYFTSFFFLFFSNIHIVTPLLGDVEHGTNFTELAVVQWYSRSSLSNVTLFKICIELRGRDFVWWAQQWDQSLTKWEPVIIVNYLEKEKSRAERQQWPLISCLRLFLLLSNPLQNVWRIVTSFSTEIIYIRGYKDMIDTYDLMTYLYRYYAHGV